MRKITYREALREALREEMRRDPTVFLLGEDIGRYWGGAFKVTEGLAEEFGDERVRDTPISESAIIGAAVGAAITGMRPVAEIMFGDLTALAVDQIANQAAKIRYMFGGQAKVPLVIRTPFGAGVNIAAHHSQSLEAWYMHVPGLYVAVPSTPYDAKGLLKTAIRNDNPVFFCEHKLLYPIEGEVPEEEYTVPLGVADVKREGEDVTVVATLYMVHKALEAAEKLETEGISVEVVDPRTLTPLDKQTIIKSVKKTGRLVVVSEDCKTAGVSAEIAAVVAEEAIDYLDAPIKRVAEPDTPIPFSPPLEQYVIPNEKSIIKAVREVV
ncbi:alpha-ketoacid dehydrogenase subunit beta [Candidatus Bathyarchaeota archaeon]|nr:MAG: alpha-ketoacid dehydrogenase subunit beta [Candidatus Bathyarchaeota archaeon]RLI16607.1 MAG: alpha-ketoacid dehydrogenase subunit beta [Candidatus Bathyarchaeota archaeon]RLI22538.1 MAG: alpha-ketoacid dehydrogenase subunit beta [Candidatus Bathyarchaeota archaeon]HDN05604.1 alpha-ketoacid dehydrogenase subunit beta [Candidatus Bathyarchaeota archaeon]